MWKLTHTKKDHVEHYIFVGEDYIVGRKDSSLLITNDPSVSRKHAVLFVKHPQENLADPTKKSSLFLRDEKSKYGTFKNGIRISAEEELKDNDLIKFGQFESEYRVHMMPLVVTTSCLDVSAKMRLRQIIYRLGGHVISEWQPSCSHLVMSLVKVTVKALCCLVALKPIVLPQYFQELQESLRNSVTTIPSSSRYIPPIGEALIDKNVVSFDVQPERKCMFKNKTFFFMDEKQFKKLHLGIVLGGGKALILSEDNNDITLLLSEDSCFIEPGKEQLVREEDKVFLKRIISVLQEKNLRMIPESDIGLAVAYASTEKFCNPKFSLGAAVFGSPKIVSQTLSEREVYVPDTEERLVRSTDGEEEKEIKQRLEIPDSSSLNTYKNNMPEKEKPNYDEAEDMDVSGIPLSAQIKQELDDIFELEVEEVDALKDDSSSLKHNKSPPKIQEFDKINTLGIATIKKVSSPEKQSSKNIAHDNFSPVKEKKSSVLSQFLPVSRILENDVIEAELPRNVVNVKFVSLICKKRELSHLQENGNSSVKNFKKFKKVRPSKAHVLPRIIGLHELIPYDKDNVKNFKENWDEPLEVTSDEPVRGEFDWETPNE